MTSNSIQCIAITLALASSSACAENKFDWSLLNGKWAESSEHRYGCRPDNLHQSFEVSSDRRTLVFKNERKWRMGPGPALVRYTATIVSQASNVLVIQYGPELKGLPDRYRQWERRFIGPGTYRWRATSMPMGSYNDVIGVKCAAK